MCSTLVARLMEEALPNVVRSAIEAVDERGAGGIGPMFVREVPQRHGCAYSLAPGETRFEIGFPVQ